MEAMTSSVTNKLIQRNLYQIFRKLTKKVLTINMKLRSGDIIGHSDRLTDIRRNKDIEIDRQINGYKDDGEI